MERFPVESRKRRVIEMAIRVLDTIVYAAVFAGGIYALFFTPATIQKELIGWEWLIPWWAAFLLLGGLLGFVGRISTIWILEPPADILAAVGASIYLIVLGKTALTSVTAAVAVTFTLVALVTLIRRYLELQLFGSDPSHQDFRSRIADALTRRTPNVPSRG